MLLLAAALGLLIASVVIVRALDARDVAQACSNINLSRQATKQVLWHTESYLKSINGDPYHRNEPKLYILIHEMHIAQADFAPIKC